MLFGDPFPLYSYCVSQILAAIWSPQTPFLTLKVFWPKQDVNKTAAAATASMSVDKELDWKRQKSK